MKMISLTDSIYKLVKENPGIENLLSDLGFKDILLPGMIDTAGRIMNLKKGAKMKKIDIEDIKKKLEENGYQITKEDLQ